MLRRAGDPLPGLRLPSGVRRELLRRLADLSDPAPHRPAGAEPALVRLGELRPHANGAPSVPGAAHVVGVFELARCRDIGAARETLAAARRALGPGGRLELVEPYRRTGRFWALVGALTPLWRRLFGLRLDLPLPALVRQAGFTLASVERFTMPTLLPPLRPFCSIVGLVPARSGEPPPPAAHDRPASPSAAARQARR